MSSVQYTIRAIPPKVDKALRERARKSGKSLNATVVTVLAQGMGVADEPRVYHDLDWFFGGKTLGKEFDEAQEWLESLPKDLDDNFK